jgi:hypothetical protein
VVEESDEMPAQDAGPPIVPLPRPVDRRLRLGPFASARDAVKFAAYAGGGAILAPFVSPYAWLPLLGFGFLVSVWRPEGEAVDERVARWATWQVRRLGGERSVRDPADPPARGGFLRLAPGRYVTILRTGGTPIAYRPPAELERVFQSYRELLRASDGVLFLQAGTSSLAEEPLLPRRADGSRADAVALKGYQELVSVLCRRRLIRRVDIALTNGEPGRDAPARLEQLTRSMAGRLAALGLRPVRLESRALLRAGHRFGWTRGKTDR